ncbi:MAG: hypothetical protein HRT58_08590 [Crocinitomicaceae bacterium]|nr:hypothetical protein [Flavobacteriales bacterium]NQZ35708.1 hypothetical protein [Crocinitomicaceae bacterium]
MLDNWLEKWYKESYLNASIKSPLTEVWDKIESKLDNEASFWYASNIASEKNSEPVSPRVWESLSAYVEAESGRVVQRRWGVVRKIGLATTLFLLPFFLSDSLKSPVGVGGQNSTQITSLSSGIKKDNLEDQLLSNVITRQTKSNEQTYGASHVVSVTAIQLSSGNEGKSLQVINDSGVGLLMDDMIVLPIHTIVLVSDYETEIVSEYRNTENSTKSNGKWRFGVGVNNQFSYLLNPVTLQGIDKHSHIDLSLSLNFSYDFSIERKVGRLGYLGVTARFNDRKTQKYRDFGTSQYFEKQLSLNYKSLFLNYSRAILTKRFNNRFGLEINSGIYVSHLNDVTEKWDNQNRYEITEGFRQVDVGVTIGMNGVFRINKLFDASLGMYYSNGVINVFKGVDTMPSYFFRTFTSSFGGTVRVRYYLGQ